MYCHNLTHLILETQQNTSFFMLSYLTHKNANRRKPTAHDKKYF